MGIIDTVTSTLSGSAGEADSSDDSASVASKGAYWCDDCNVRVRDVAVDERRLDRDSDDTPLCPECGSAMRFERNYGESCAC